MKYTLLATATGSQATQCKETQCSRSRLRNVERGATHRHDSSSITIQASRLYHNRICRCNPGKDKQVCKYLFHRLLIFLRLVLKLLTPP